MLQVFDKAVREITTNPDAARAYLTKYTALTDEQASMVGLPVWKMSVDLKSSDLDALQKFLDIFTENKVVDRTMDVRQLMYLGK